MNIATLIRDELKANWKPIAVFAGLLFVVVFIIVVVSGDGSRDYSISKKENRIIVNQDEIVEVGAGDLQLDSEVVKYKKVKNYFIRKAGRNRYFLKKKKYDLLIVDYFNPPLVKQGEAFSVVKKQTNVAVKVVKKKTKNEKETDYLFGTQKKN